MASLLRNFRIANLLCNACRVYLYGGASAQGTPNDTRVIHSVMARFNRELAVDRKNRQTPVDLPDLHHAWGTSMHRAIVTAALDGAKVSGPTGQVHRDLVKSAHFGYKHRPFSKSGMYANLEIAMGSTRTGPYTSVTFGVTNRTQLLNKVSGGAFEAESEWRLMDGPQGGPTVPSE